MGGLGGHLMHLYDDRDLTCIDMSRIFSLLSTGQLPCYEKFDGINIAISWDQVRRVPIAARSKADVAAGGLQFHELANRFASQPNAKATFDAAFVVLGPAMSAVCPAFNFLFPAHCPEFLSAEILWSGNPNVIRYDGNHIIIHRTVAPYRAGAAEAITCHATEEQLQALASALNSAIGPGWSVSLPPAVTRSAGPVTNFDSRLIRVFSSSATIGDLIRYRLALDPRIPWLDLPRRRMFVDRLMGVKGSPTIVDITRGLTKGQSSILRAMNSDAQAVVSSSIGDLVELVDDFAVELLSGFHSSLVRDCMQEASRLRHTVYADSIVLTKTGDPKLVDLVNKNRARIKNASNISAIEGIVFGYMGQNYKLTGSFAPVNQIIGARKRLNQL